MYERVLALDPRNFDALHLLGLILASSEPHTSRGLQLMDQALRVLPANAAALCNRGNALDARGRHADAIASHDQALAVAPAQAESWFGRAVALRSLGRREEALQSCEKAVGLQPGYVDAWLLRADLHVLLGRHGEAVASYDRVFALAPQRDFVPGFRLHAKMYLCDWSDHEREVADLLGRIDQRARASTGMPVLAVTDSLDLQRKAAETWIAHKCPPDARLGPIAPRPRGQRMRVGYFSMDFREHPVSHLTAELYELHDRERFEVLAFAWGANTGDAMRKRLETAFDTFIDVNGRTDREVAQICREQGLDIAVDLAGLTAHSRPGIFAARAAPVQVNYLGYPGTSGAPFMDYLIADGIVVPESAGHGYTEQIARVPVFQVNDRKRRISGRVFTREELGIAHAPFVFCCFSQSYKITPDVFESWMRTLARVPGSVLLLAGGDSAVELNLVARAAVAGVNGARLVFTDRVPYADFLARLAVADLYLDTFPFNGGTTTSDALWSGLPVLTRAGEALASRMGASLLSAAGLPELVTHDARGYEELAVALGLDPARTHAVSARLQAHRQSSRLFDAPRFTRHLEDVFEQMDARWRSGLPPVPLSSRLQD